MYKRRPPGEEDGTRGGNTFMKKKGGAYKRIDNRYVVPHNRYMLMKLGSHINVEYVTQNGGGSQKYLYKYPFKGAEHALITVLKKKKKKDKDKDGGGEPEEEEQVDYDEFVQFLSVHRGAAEAFMRMMSYPLTRLSHDPIRLAVHLDGDDPVYFKEGEVPLDGGGVSRGPKVRTSKFRAYMDYNAKHPTEEEKYTFLDLPNHYKFSASTREWKPRGEKTPKGGFVIPLIYRVAHEIFPLILLKWLFNIDSDHHGHNPEFAP